MYDGVGGWVWWEEWWGVERSTFDFVFADIDVGGRGDGVRGEVVDHFACGECGVCNKRLRGGNRSSV